MAEINTWPGWECVRQLGAGSFGKVYEIQKIEHGKVYKSALKVITIPQNDADIENAYSEGLDRNGVTEYFKSFVNDFSNEIALMSDLKGYTNIVSYEDHMVISHEDKIGWDILIKMELLTPLLEWEKEHPLQEDDIIRLGVDMCRALELCHKNKIIHRDIKPQNIFVNKNGDFKLGDFGIARVVEKTSSVMSQKGTYTYMAPEVFRGQYYNESADIYSLGIVLYRCLNQNRTPFLPLGNMNFNDRQIAQERRMSGEVIPAPVNGSVALKLAVLKTLQYEPEKRVQSADVFRKILEKCRDAQVATTSPAQSISSAQQMNILADEDKTIPVRYSMPVQSANIVTDEDKTMPVHNILTDKNTSPMQETPVISTGEETVLNIPKTPIKPKKKSKKGVIAVVIAGVILFGIGKLAGKLAVDTVTGNSTEQETNVQEDWHSDESEEVDSLAKQLNDDEILLTVGNDVFVYRLPETLDVFLSHGWKVDYEVSAKYIDPHSADWVKIYTEDSIVGLLLLNSSGKTKVLNNTPKYENFEGCKVVGIVGFESSNGKFLIKNGLSYDSFPDEVEAIYGSNTDYHENDSEIYYVWNEEKNIQILYNSSIATENDENVMLFLEPKISAAFRRDYGDILLWNILK